MSFGSLPMDREHVSMELAVILICNQTSGAQEPGACHCPPHFSKDLFLKLTTNMRKDLFISLFGRKSLPLHFFVFE
jgi:hypothetical protein